MQDLTKTLEQLGREVAGSLGTGPDAARREAMSRSMRSVAFSVFAPRRRKLLVPAFAALILILVASLATLKYLPRADAPLSFWVGQNAGTGDYGGWLRASAQENLPVRFEDGSQLEFLEQSDGRIFATDSKNVRIALGQGTVKARIQSGKKRRWTVEAGPYSVTALGTEFSVHWIAELGIFEVEVSSGVVLVQGPDLEPQGVRIAKHDRLRIDQQCNQVHRHLNTQDQDITIDSEANQNQPPATKTAPARKIRRKHRAPVASLAPRGNQLSKWQEYYHSGQYLAAVQAAEQYGLTAILNEADSTDLWQLADAARFARRGPVARQALLSIRKRFGGSWRSKVAAFLLGRVAIEFAQDAIAAADWFKTYLREDPSGSLAEEALGRLIDACQKANRAHEASQSAQKYLRLYPDGLFSTLARSVLDQ